jgi:hypothetical protein
MRCGWFSHPLRYSFRHSLLCALHPSLRSGFSAAHNAPLPSRALLRKSGFQSFGKMLEPRYVVGARALDQ